MPSHRLLKYMRVPPCALHCSLDNSRMKGVSLARRQSEVPLISEVHPEHITQCLQALACPFSMCGSRNTRKNVLSTVHRAPYPFDPRTLKIPSLSSPPKACKLTHVAVRKIRKTIHSARALLSSSVPPPDPHHTSRPRGEAYTGATRPP